MKPPFHIDFLTWINCVFLIIKSNFRKQSAFSLVELLTTVGIVGVLSVIGIKSYQKQTYRAKQAEAKKSLSYVYSAEQNFRESWGTYHENLIVIGAIPSGAYHYDVGFHKDAAINDGVSNTDRGRLGSYPLKESLNVKACTNFYQICGGNCETSAKNQITDADAKLYFETEGKCTVNGCTDGTNCLKDITLTGYDDAKLTKFEAVAIGELRSKDIWSINQEKTVTHKEDGAQ